MKAYHILIFIFILNLSIGMMQTMGIYNLHYSAAVYTAEQVTVAIIAGLLAALGVAYGAAIINPLNNSGLDLQMAIIAFFSVEFWILYSQTALLIYDLIAGASSALRPVGFSITVVISIIVVLVYSAGLHQMVTGGWKSYE